MNCCLHTTDKKLILLQGNPYTGCIQGECDENSDCGPQRACKDYKENKYKNTFFIMLLIV